MRTKGFIVVLGQALIRNNTFENNITAPISLLKRCDVALNASLKFPLYPVILTGGDPKGIGITEADYMFNVIESLSNTLSSSSLSLLSSSSSLSLSSSLSASLSSNRLFLFDRLAKNTVENALNVYNIIEQMKEQNSTIRESNHYSRMGNDEAADREKRERLVEFSNGKEDEDEEEKEKEKEEEEVRYKIHLVTNEFHMTRAKCIFECVFNTMNNRNNNNYNYRNDYNCISNIEFIEECADSCLQPYGKYRNINDRSDDENTWLCERLDFERNAMESINNYLLKYDLIIPQCIIDKALRELKQMNETLQQQMTDNNKTTPSLNTKS